MADDSLDALRARLDALARGDVAADRQWDAHAAVLDRLVALQRTAEAAGWGSLAIERGGAAEPFRLFGVPPGASLRAEVPDSLAGDAAGGGRDAPR